MGAGRRRRGRFLCFGLAADAVADEEKEEKDAMERSISTGFPNGGSEGLEPKLRRRRPKLLRRILTGVVRSVSAQEPSGKTREESGRSLPRKTSDARAKSTDDVDRRPDATLFSSLSSSSSSSASSAASSSSLFSSTTSSSFGASESKSVREKAPESKSLREKAPAEAEPRRPAPARRSCDPAIGLSLLLVSLFVMVVCGRVCAILWTSTWLFLVLRRNPDVRPPKSGTAVEDSLELRPKGCDEYEKKRIVLEGLLERNRRI